uniref:RHD domain-containing protein n=1 Tax=Knipowitschia caucasica TaxID=637954 RepID=A0AAV2M8T2_KNICA
MDAPGLSEHPHQDINEQELDFSDLFLCHHDDDLHGLLPNSHPPMLEVDCPSIRHYSSPPEPGQDPTAAHRTHQEPTADLHTHFISPGLSSRSSLIPAPSPRIEITPSGDSLSSHPHTQPQGPTALGVYRECSSPGSSNSSTGWPSENCSPLVSPCASPCNSGGYSLSALDLCPGLRAFHTSSTHSTPGGSPHSNVPYETFLLPHQPTVPTKLSQPHQRSRSLSPQGKRSYHQLHSCTGPTPAKQRSRSPSPSPVPSPNEPQRSHYLHQHHSPTPVLSGLLSGLNAAGKVQQPEKDVRAEVTSEAFYIIPNVWPAPTHHGAFSVSMAALPSLEWQLPSEVGQYKLQIQQQPRAFHRAHYETEGSRGAVKTASGGHPQVQLLGYHGSSSLRLQVFIGTADERQMKPHSFYQVHRVTGKTASSSRCEESAVYGTKVLEIPLEPKNNMRVM